MNFETENCNTTDELFVKLSGMLRYAVKHNEGLAEIKRLANATGVTGEIIECTTELFNDEGITDCEKIDEKNLKLTYINPTELSKLKQNELAKEIEDLLKKQSEYKNNWLNSDTEEIKKCVREILG